MSESDRRAAAGRVAPAEAGRAAEVAASRVAPLAAGRVAPASRLEFRSDTFTLPTPEMMRAIAEAELGDDVYGEDPTVRRLEALSAARLGKEAACLVPSGTMANLVSVLAHCPRGSKVLVGDESDLYVYEAGGASVLGGVAYEPVPTRPNGRLDLEDLARALPPDPDDPQFAPASLVCLEDPHNRMGGRVLPLDYLLAVREFADEAGLRVHLDGARLFNAAVAMGVEAAEIAQYADSVQFCLSKGLSAPIGSVVVGGAAFIGRVRRLRKMLGGGMRQAGIIAAAGIVALEAMVERLADDHRNARRLAEGLSRLPGLVLDPPVVETNMVLFRVTDPRFTWSSLLDACRARGLYLSELGHGRLRAATHSGIAPTDVDQAVAIVAEVLRTGPPEGVGG